MRRLILLFVLLILGDAAPSAAQPVARNVLLLHSFEREFAPHTAFTEMFRSELSRRSPEPINFFEASIQPAPFGPTPQEDPIVNYLTSTVAGQKLDLVVTVGGPAAAFAQKYRARLFPTTPLLQAGLDWRWVQNQPPARNDTAVAAAEDMPQMIRNILEVLPGTKRVFIVIGASEYEKFWREELGREFEPFKDRLTLIWANDLSFTQMLERASTLPPHSAIFYAVLSLDAVGVVQTQARALTQLHAVATAPMFGMYDIQVGLGVVGGRLTQVVDISRTSADVALRILRGESPGAIKTPPQTQGQPIYDWRELQRWGIREAALPAGSTVQFRQPSGWDQYRVYILLAITIVGLQTTLIGGLFVQRARRRRMELALRESERRFRVIAGQNQDLAGRLINAQEAERTRIARDLHDDVSQQLAGLAIMLSGLKRKMGKPDAQPDVDQTVVTLQDRTSALAETIRSLSHELHPSMLQHGGLVAALKRHCRDLEQDHHLKVTFSGAGNLDLLPPDVALCLFRVVQESLTNAVRHASAHSIQVTLTATNETIELRVVDDGVGFVASERAGRGLGLRSIDERVRLTGGSVSLESQPGRGTNVAVRIPHSPVPAALAQEV